jgi:outer membrane protein assembly factor BamB
LTLVRSLPKPAYKSGYGSGDVDATFTDDLIVFADTRGFLTALDRESGRQRWRVKMKSSLPGGDTLCGLAVPSATASTVVANHGGGWLCGDFTVYDLRTGRIRLTYESVSEVGRSIGFELPANLPMRVLDGRTYWIDDDDRMRVLEDDGSSSMIGSLLTLLGRPKQMKYNVSAFQLLPGTDVFMARYVPPKKYDPDTFGKSGDSGFLVGLRLDENGLPKRIWRQPIEKLMSAPGHRPDSFFLTEETLGLIGDVEKVGGRRFVRTRAVDPETGEWTGRGIRVPYDGLRPGGPGVPVFVKDYGPEHALAVGDDALLTPYEVPRRNGETSVVRYQVSTGKVVWQWAMPGAIRAPYPPNIDVLAITPDRSRVYVNGEQDYDNRIWELDYDTGRLLHDWQLPTRAPYKYDMNFARMFLDDGDVFQINPAAYADQKVMAGLLRVAQES